MLNRSYLLASQLMSMFTVSIMLFLNNEKLLVSSFFFFLVTTSIGATINVHFAGMYFLVNSPIISSNTDYHFLKKNCKLHTDIFIIILIIIFATIIILQKQLYFNLSITVDPPLSCHPQGTGISGHLMEVGPLIEVRHKLV